MCALGRPTSAHYYQHWHDKIFSIFLISIIDLSSLRGLPNYQMHAITIIRSRSSSLNIKMCSKTYLNIRKDAEVIDDPIAYLVIWQQVNFSLYAAPCRG